ncbi:M23 family metallopeptidase [Nocardioides sp. AX2bis]|uniref:M23 family metallopeptidase n=1 Tax=Nocardioides sp. AX2bis TaxID=2653157 RepID=UPI0012F2A7B0|nr:M23 family metallopeptidase [Nocardioides sp. AX2bis]VXB77546.1 Membrane proteins related to metalloendopeptidases [Nocardioides sp. AX2bis]
MTPTRYRRLAPLLLALLLLVTCPLPGSAAEQVPVGTWPLRPQPAVAHLFAPPPTPYAAGHRGVDLAAAAGQPVRAALPGTVTFAGSIAGRGVVVVDHGDTRTTYEPVDASVRSGAEVDAGDPVGRVRPGPASHCFPATCLHWGWIAGQTYLDPLLLVGAGPVRLLPLVAGASLVVATAPPGYRPNPSAAFQVSLSP